MVPASSMCIVSTATYKAAHVAFTQEEAQHSLVHSAVDGDTVDKPALGKSRTPAKTRWPRTSSGCSGRCSTQRFQTQRARCKHKPLRSTCETTYTSRAAGDITRSVLAKRRIAAVQIRRKNAHNLQQTTREQALSQCPVPLQRNEPRHPSRWHTTVHCLDPDASRSRKHT